MSIKKSCTLPPPPDKIIGHFGQVLLVRKGNGLYDLIGGNEQERHLARTWCAVHASFLPLMASPENILVLTA